MTEITGGKSYVLNDCRGHSPFLNNFVRRYVSRILRMSSVGWEMFTQWDKISQRWLVNCIKCYSYSML